MHLTRARWPANGESIFASLAPPRGQPSAQYRITARVAEHASRSKFICDTYGGSDRQLGMLTASQQKLNIRMFYQSELYKGLDFKITFVRLVSLAEAHVISCKRRT